MLLSFLKNSESRTHKAATFRRKFSAFQNGIANTIDAKKNALQKEIMRKYEEHYKMI